MLFLAIFTGIATLLNYFWWANYPPSGGMQLVSIVGQVLLTILTVAAMVRFRGRRTRKNYEMVRVFTLPFGLMFLSLLGNLAVLVILVLLKLGVLQSL
ncbi:MAG: hypothetical protein LBR72_08390 [Oscillospiraceae bacterium]|nr:hypothetical protein [Oscillospiraceae bacterium]